MKLDHTANGVYVIGATPFNPDGGLDLASLDSLTDFYLDCGATGLTILGILGEAQKLEPEESLTVVRRVIARARGVPIVVGASAAGFAAMRRIARESMDLGAAGVMIAPPNTLRMDDQIVSYYAQAVQAIGEDVPVCVQDHPLAVTVKMSTSVIRRILTDHDSCVMLKHEDWPGLEKISALREMQARGELKPVSILCGNGGVFLDFEMERGADGAMTGYAFPDMLADLVRLAKSGNRDAAHDLFDAHLPLLRYEQQPGVGLAARKYVLWRRGAIRHDTQRTPGSTLSAKARAEVDFLLDRLALRDPRARLPARP